MSKYIFNIADDEKIIITMDNDAEPKTDDEAEVSQGETVAVTEESAYDNIKNEAASFPEALQLAWQGMLGIFIVSLLIIAVTSLLNAVTSKKNKNIEQ